MAAKRKLLLGPRPELVREYLDEVGKSFFMYTPAEFLRAAPSYLALTVSPDAVAEIERISEATPILAILRAQRMVLPDPSSRVRALGHIFDAISLAKVAKVGDLNSVIEGLGDHFATNFVEAPLFFSLISETYGPLNVTYDPSLRLRDRNLQIAASATTKEQFVQLAHAAWLAQALYRLRLEGLATEELLVAFFGEDYSAEARALVAHAQRLVGADLTYRGN